MTNSTWTTHSFERVGKDVVIIKFRTREPFTHLPGQFINIKMEIGGETLIRSYSLSSTSSLDELPEVAIKRIPGGVFSNYVVDNMENIKEWDIEGPMGNFYLSDEVVNKAPIVLVAAGSGITPILSMLKYCLHYSDKEVILFYGSRSADEMLYYDEIESLRQEYRSRFKLFYFLSQGTGEYTEGHFIHGRISKLVFKKLLKENLSDGILNAHYYICGPEGLIEAIQNTLEGLGVTKEYTHREYFYKSPEQNDMILPDTMLEVLLHHNEQTNLLEVLPGETILDSALRDRIPVRYSCKGGTCGVCIAKRTDGMLVMRSNYALTEAQVNDGYVLLCQSHPIDNAVTVESFS
ncbi:MAG: 2Fe-2S iron-sulfur cluster binding domain-containing protein [Bacteroidetes bacterium]|nr:2Fe-2S iron-sulfur cluster binding domain-containing protein [Bacteroidota bacterium]